MGGLLIPSGAGVGDTALARLDNGYVLGCWLFVTVSFWYDAVSSGTTYKRFNQPTPQGGQAGLRSLGPQNSKNLVGLCRESIGPMAASG